jgi:hypothetical protein
MDLIIDLYKYFSKFVPKQVLIDRFIQPDTTQNVGYSEVESEILARGNESVIDRIESFIVSINENYVSQRVKNAKSVTLFVEYGKISLWIILDSIIRTMQEEQEELEFCGITELVTYPIEIQPVDPVTFYGRGGWCALFQNSTTLL